MKLNLNFLPLRIIKTVVAFFITLILAPFFQCDSFFAGIGSLKSMRQSLSLSIYALVEQLSSNFIAFILAIMFAYTLGLNPFSISLALLILFLVIKQIESIDTYLTSAFTLVAIMLLSNSTEELLTHSFDRFYSLTFGMIIALIVNAVLFKPKKVEDLNQLLIKLNQYIHLYINHGLEEYSYLEIKNTLEELEKEKVIAQEELSIRYIPQEKKTRLQARLDEIAIVEAQTDVVFELPYLDDNFRELMIPIIIRLNAIKQYLNDTDELIQIKQELKELYHQHTTDDTFFENTKFLAILNIYVELLLDYQIKPIIN